MTLQERLERRVFNPKLCHNIILPYAVLVHRRKHQQTRTTAIKQILNEILRIKLETQLAGFA